MGVILSPHNTRPTVGTCSTPDCRQRGGHGLTGAFCKRHAKRLAAIREEFQAEQQARCPSFANNGKRGPQQPPICCTPGCAEQRKRGEAFCLTCQVMGETSDAAA